MIDFKEEIKKYKPILNVDDVQSELKDTIDLLEQMSKVNQIIQNVPQIPPQASPYATLPHSGEPRGLRANETRIPELRVIETEAKIEPKAEPEPKIENTINTINTIDAKVDSELPKIDNLSRINTDPTEADETYEEPHFEMPVNEER